MVTRANGLTSSKKPESTRRVKDNANPRTASPGMLGSGLPKRPRMMHIDLSDPSSWAGQITNGDLYNAAGDKKGAKLLLQHLDFLIGQAGNDASSADERELSPELRSAIQALPVTLGKLKTIVEKASYALGQEHPRTQIDRALTNSLVVLFGKEMTQEIARLALARSLGEKVTTAFQALQNYLNDIKKSAIDRIQNREPV